MSTRNLYTCIHVTRGHGRVCLCVCVCACVRVRVVCVRVCAYVYLYVCIPVYKHIGLALRICSLRRIRNTYIHTHILRYVNLYTNIHTHTHAYTYLVHFPLMCSRFFPAAHCLWVHTYVYTHLHKYVHVHTLNEVPQFLLHRSLFFFSSHCRWVNCPLSATLWGASFRALRLRTRWCANIAPTYTRTALSAARILAIFTLVTCVMYACDVCVWCVCVYICM